MGRRCLPRYASKFSRRDFALPQLFACLVLREHQRKSYRGVEALLRDAPHWCREIGMRRVPDHNTLCRAWSVIARHAKVRRMLDLLARWFDEAGELGPLLAVDAAHFEARHAGRYYERRCRRMAEREGQTPDKRGSYTRSGAMAGIPKLTVAVDAGSHLALSAVASTGLGGDGPHLEPVLFDAWRRGRVKVVVADAGYDSEPNHRLARLDMGLASIIPPNLGRRHKSGRPTARYRRMMHARFARDGGGADYRQRAQAEAANSMIKRNLGSGLRCRTPARRELEMLLRVVIHNIMLLWRQTRGSRRSPSGRVYRHFQMAGDSGYDVGGGSKRRIAPSNRGCRSKCRTLTRAIACRLA